MKLPRFSLPTIMAAVAVIALDCATILAIGRRHEALTTEITILVVACLPMAHVLALVLALMVRRQGRPRPFHLGFVVGGWLAVAATVIGYDPLFSGIEWLLEFAGYPEVLAAQSVGMFVLAIAIVATLFLLGQLLVASAGGWLATLLPSRGEARATDDLAPPRRRLASRLLPVALIAMVTLATEGYLRFVVDPKLQRLRPGTMALVDLTDEPVPPAGYPKAITVLQDHPVRVEHDDDAEKLELIFDSRSPDPRIRHLRMVEVTILQGDRAGRTIILPHSMLRTKR